MNYAKILKKRYKPFKTESELEPECIERCKAKYDEISMHNGVRKVSNVKKILMEHLETVDEGTERAKEVIESNAGAILDAANEQENAECEDEELIDHPDFFAKDLDQLDDVQKESTSNRQYKKVELYWITVFVSNQHNNRNHNQRMQP